MEKSTNNGTYFWRNGEKIELEKEPEFFTALARDEKQLKQLREIPGVEEVKNVQNQVFKVRVKADKREPAMAAFRSKDHHGIAHHAYKPKNSESTRYYLTDQIIARFKANIEDKKIESILSQNALKLLKEYPGESKTYLLQVTDQSGKNPIKVANELTNLNEVEYAEPNLINRFQSFYSPSDTYFNRQWHLKAWQAPDLNPVADISASQAWELTRGSREVVVAVIDDGFDLSHPDFTGEGKVVFPKDFIDGDAKPFPESSSDDYHGTPCAGVAIAEENGKGVVGAAPGCAFMPVRFSLSATDDEMWEIFDYAGKNAHVISCSWGPPPVYAPLSSLLSQKFHQISTSGGPDGKGCLIMFAAGNYNAPLKDMDNKSFKWLDYSYGIRETKGPILNGNATHPDVVAVAASTSLAKKAAYSNWGDQIWIAAPSNNFHPLEPESYVPGRGIWTTDNEKNGSGFTSNSIYTGSFGGTSSATPLAAGVAGLIFSANPDLTASEVKTILKETADKITDTEPDPVLGLKKGTYDSSGHSEWFGFGKINAAKAVEKASENRMDVPVVHDIELAASLSGNLSKEDDYQIFRLNWSKKLKVSLNGPANHDFDLYVKKGSPPDPKNFDEGSYSNTSNENVLLTADGSGDVFIMVHSYKGSGDFKLVLEPE